MGDFDDILQEANANNLDSVEEGFSLFDGNEEPLPWLYGDEGDDFVQTLYPNEEVRDYQKKLNYILKAHADSCGICWPELEPTGFESKMMEMAVSAFQSFAGMLPTSRGKLDESTKLMINTYYFHNELELLEGTSPEGGTSKEYSMPSISPKEIALRGITITNEILEAKKYKEFIKLCEEMEKEYPDIIKNLENALGKSKQPGFDESIRNLLKRIKENRDALKKFNETKSIGSLRRNKLELDDLGDIVKEQRRLIGSRPPFAGSRITKAMKAFKYLGALPGFLGWKTVLDDYTQMCHNLVAGNPDDAIMNLTNFGIHVVENVLGDVAAFGGPVTVIVYAALTYAFDEYVWDEETQSALKKSINDFAANKGAPTLKAWYDKMISDMFGGGGWLSLPIQ